MGSLRQRTIHEDAIDSLLDRLGNIREEVLRIERSLERIQAQTSKLVQRTDDSGKRPR